MERERAGTSVMGRSENSGSGLISSSRGRVRGRSRKGSVPMAGDRARKCGLQAGVKLRLISPNYPN